MPLITHTNAPTQFVSVAGTRFAFRRLGPDTGIPLVMLNHFRAGLDHWDPSVIDGLAISRPVILFNNAGVGASSGHTPDTIEEMAAQVAAFADALRLSLIDVLGFSIGGYVAQSLASNRPDLVRRLVLVGTGLRAGEPRTDARVAEVAANPVPTCEDFLFLFFAPSATSQSAGKAFWNRRHARTVDIDPPSPPQTTHAQSSAIALYRQPRGERFSELAAINQPVLVIGGANDIMIPTVNSFLLQQNLSNAQLIIYPDSGHGVLFQYPDQSVTQVQMFLAAVDRSDAPTRHAAK